MVGSTIQEQNELILNHAVWYDSVRGNQYSNVFFANIRGKENGRFFAVVEEENIQCKAFIQSLGDRKQRLKISHPGASLPRSTVIGSDAAGTTAMPRM